MNTFWINNISILFNKNNFLEVIPLPNMKLNDKLNAIFRLSIYYFIIIKIVKKNLKNIFIPILVGIITIIIYNNYKQINNIETIDINDNMAKTKNNVSSNNNSGVPGCKLPTKENPFMNPTIGDYSLGNFEESCHSYNNNVVRDLEEINFDKSLYKNKSDIFNKNNSQREFYTMPVNSIVNDQGGFSEWCYGRPPSCKQGNGIQCSANLSGIYGSNKSIVN